MNPWILFAIGVTSIFLIVLAFAKLEFQYPPNWWMMGIGTLVLFGLGLYGIRILNAPPTRTETTEEKRDKPEVIAAATLKDKLDEIWNADSYPIWPIASELAQCSSDAYLDPVDIEAELKKRGYQDVKPLNKGSLVGYVAFLDETAVVIFRGTNPNDIQDWFVNLDTRSEKIQHGTVHAGFWTAYDSLHEQLTKVLRAKNPKRIWITGHSLGGAMAAICGYRLLGIENLEIAGLMTFGQPKVGSKDFCNHIDRMLSGRAVYFVNQRDVVPRVPPNFDQYGSLVWYTAGGIRRSKPSESPMQARFGQVPGEVEEIQDEDYFELPAMTQEEFEQMKRKMIPRDMQNSSEGEKVMLSRMRFINDHDIEEYIERLK